MMKGKNIVLGVTGGIAAYKAADLCSRLIKVGANVDVVMTEHATSFINPLTFQTLSGNPVVVKQFETPKGWELAHISLSQKADLFAIVPATANIIAKMANGIADDFLSTALLATTAPVMIAPAMNTKMFEHPAVQENIKTLRKRGVVVLETAEGRLACGDVGKGKLLGVEEIVFAMEKSLSKADFSGLSLTITAGPTAAAIDPVRLITNRSTGKMGFELARQASRRGAKVDLIAKTCPEKLQRVVNWIPILTTSDMATAVAASFKNTNGLIMAAAPLDYQPKQIEMEKIKKSDGNLEITLVRTVDILRTTPRQMGQVVIGFAAESQNLIENAKKKCREKSLDLVVANDISRKDIGFGSDENQVSLVDLVNVEALPKMTKASVADRILDRFLRIRESK
jgi:phosphopantothenoylcysteine decarboxylase/phosphopantothenate--cysteine ligase